jgi:hypothetical protein
MTEIKRAYRAGVRSTGRLTEVKEAIVSPG